MATKGSVFAPKKYPSFDIHEIRHFFAENVAPSSRM
jgi:hypothetical protein